MSVLRACALHGCSLLDDDESCPVGHFVESWLIVQDGIVIAEADETSARWLRTGKLDDELVPDPDLRGRRPWVHFAMDAPVEERKLARKKRYRERERAKREGREPAEWARAHRGSPGFEEVDASFLRSRKFRAEHRDERG